MVKRYYYDVFEEEFLPRDKGKWVEYSEYASLESRHRDLVAAAQWVVNVEGLAAQLSGQNGIPGGTDIQAIMLQNHKNRIASFEALRKALKREDSVSQEVKSSSNQL